MSELIDLLTSSIKNLTRFRPQDIPWGSLFKLQGDVSFAKAKSIFKSYTSFGIIFSGLVALVTVMRNFSFDLISMMLSGGALVSFAITLGVMLLIRGWLNKTTRQTWPVIWYSIIVCLWVMDALALCQSILAIVSSFKFSLFTMLLRLINLVGTFVYFALLYNFVLDFKELAEGTSADVEDNSDDIIIGDEPEPMHPTRSARHNMNTTNFRQPYEEPEVPTQTPSQTAASEAAFRARQARELEEFRRRQEAQASFQRQQQPPVTSPVHTPAPEPVYTPPHENHPIVSDSLQVPPQEVYVPEEDIPLFGGTTGQGMSFGQKLDMQEQIPYAQPMESVQEFGGFSMESGGQVQPRPMHPEMEYIKTDEPLPQFPSDFNDPDMNKPLF